MFKIKQQLRRLYAVTAISSLQIAGASWVALLAARGFSLTEIGFAEGVFHFVSFLFEVPSGVIADVFGRKRSMVASQCMFAAASAAIIPLAPPPMMMTSRLISAPPACGG